MRASGSTGAGSAISSLLDGKGPLLLPGAHDALSARLIEHMGFRGYGIGGAALSATQLGLPDLGLQSFGEYRDSVARIMQATEIPVMVDGENGFGDAKAVTRTVRTFETMGVAALALEDLAFPPVLGTPPAVIGIDDMLRKLDAALQARSGPMSIIGRTDAVGVAGVDEGLERARRFAALGVDAVLATGLTDVESMKRLRDVVDLPLVALVVEGGPWLALPPDELFALGFELVLYPATLLSRATASYRDGLEAIRSGDVEPAPAAVARDELLEILRLSDWAAVDARQ